MKLKVRDALPFGREKAIPAKALADALGFPTTIELRKQIERERERPVLLFFPIATVADIICPTIRRNCGDLHGH